jgi:hypothetical protein
VETSRRLTSLLVCISLATVFAGCMVGPGQGGYGVVVVPPLPAVVVLESEPYYQQGGYYYYYQGDRWSYSNSRGGPWVELPPDRYPKEVRFKDKGGGQGKGEKHGHDKD